MTDAPNHETDSFFRRHRISLGLMFAVAVQTATFIVWLTQMRSDVTQLQVEHGAMRVTMDRIDQGGTRALDVIRSRQTDVIATNGAQDARLRDLENKIGELQRQTTEHRVWIDQLAATIRALAYPVPQKPPP